MSGGEKVGGRIHIHAGDSYLSLFIYVVGCLCIFILLLYLLLLLLLIELCESSDLVELFSRLR